MRKKFVSAAKRVGVDLFEFAVPEIKQVVSGWQNIKTAAKKVERQTLTEQLGSGSRKMSASRVILTKSAKQISRVGETFLQTFLTNLVE